MASVIINHANVARFRTTHDELVATKVAALVAAAAAIKVELDKYTAETLATGHFVTHEEQNIQSEGIDVLGGTVGIVAVDTLPPAKRF